MKFNAATGWDWREEDCFSDDDGFLDDEEQNSEDEISPEEHAQSRKIQTLLVLKSPFMLENCQLGSPSYFYPGTDYNVHMNFFLPEQNSKFGTAKIIIVPKNKHRFSAVLSNANLDEFGYEFKDEFRLDIVSGRKFRIIFLNPIHNHKDTINIFNDGLSGMLSLDEKNVEFLQVNSREIIYKLFISKYRLTHNTRKN
ncbi:MAG: hypothetical protein KC505_06800 [Myxococcales bacterium]|nr:hypothetical protein [Myxococcales bacterium]USN51029.1 MAG: hypothetical protein H6731_01050 [Myxococcales bacterium]